MARILHLDSSAAKTIVLLSEDGEIIKYAEHDGARDAASVINTLIQTTFEAAGWETGDADAVAVCTGPGSYTGLRIALATAKGIAYALDKPLIAHTRLDIALCFLKVSRPECEACLAVIPTRAGEYFVAATGINNAQFLDQQLITTPDLQTFINEQLSGAGLCIWGQPGPDISTENIPAITVTEDIYPDTAAWCRLANQAFLDRQFASLALLEPAYLKQVFIYESKKT